VDEHASGAVAGRLATDAAYLRGAVGDQVAVVAQNLVTCIAGFTLGARQDAAFTSSLLALIAPTLFADQPLSFVWHLQASTMAGRWRFSYWESCRF